MLSQPDCSFVLSVESGPLEAQAVLLVESLRKFGGSYADCPVYAVSPRPSRQMGQTCRNHLEKMGVQVIVEELLSPNEAYGSLGRLAACAWAEKNINSEILAGLDNDLFFTAAPDFSLNQRDFLARPVDVKGICTSGPNDPLDNYWRKIAAICGVNYDEIPWVETTVDRATVKASYNGGMIVVRRKSGIFQTAQEMFLLLRKNDLAPRKADVAEVFASTGFVGKESSRWWGTSQVVLSLAATQCRAAISIAPATYNVPIHSMEEAAKLGNTITLEHAVVIHYHWLLYKEYITKANFLYEAEVFPPAVAQWLKSRTPIESLYS